MIDSFGLKSPPLKQVHRTYIALQCVLIFRVGGSAGPSASSLALTLSGPLVASLSVPLSLLLALPSFLLFLSSVPSVRPQTPRGGSERASVAFRRTEKGMNPKCRGKTPDQCKHGSPLSSASVRGTDSLMSENELRLLLKWITVIDDNPGRVKYPSAAAAVAQRDIEVAASLCFDVLPARRRDQRGRPRQPRQGETPLAREEGVGGGRRRAADDEHHGEVRASPFRTARLILMGSSRSFT